MIKQGPYTTGDFIWNYKHYNNHFAGNNATNALHHVLKKKGQKINSARTLFLLFNSVNFKIFMKNLDRQSLKVLIFCLLLSMMDPLL